MRGGGGGGGGGSFFFCHTLQNWNKGHYKKFVGGHILSIFRENFPSHICKKKPVREFKVRKVFKEGQNCIP